MGDAPPPLSKSSQTAFKKILCCCNLFLWYPRFILRSHRYLVLHTTAPHRPVVRRSVSYRPIPDPYELVTNGQLETQENGAMFMAASLTVTPNADFNIGRQNIMNIPSKYCPVYQPMMTSLSESITWSVRKLCTTRIMMLHLMSRISILKTNKILHIPDAVNAPDIQRNLL
eukprot:GFKZ01014595.1.p1 GENE.GFKZ01014595.1~~GFKZ01014595.1.p1  ORF type:complete len:171 (-),score=3.36 GFKZ01014595.1:597-1109(-)